MAASCELYPKVGNEDSVMYKELIKLVKNRPLTNLIYASYLLPGVATHMTNNYGMKLNSQGQHSAKDVMQYFDVASMQNEASRIFDVEQRIGAKDSNGNYINYANSEEALDKAIQANSNHARTTQANHNMNGFVSFVVRKGNDFNIITVPQDSRTQQRVFDMEKAKATWDDVKQAFQNTFGVDINTFNFNKERFNVLNAKGIITWASQLSGVRNDVLTKNDIRAILEINQNVPQVSSQIQRLMTAFGSLDNVAEKAYTYFQNNTGVTSGQADLIKHVVNEGKQFYGLNLNTLQAKVTQTETDVAQTSTEHEVQQILEDLHRRYNIDIDEIHRQSQNIRTLADAAADAAASLKRQLYKIKAQMGVTPEVRRLEQEMNRLLKEIANNNYYTGLLNFLGEALKQAQNVENLFNQASQTTGTTLERCRDRAKALMEIKSILDGYGRIVDSLTDIEKIITEENISPTDKQRIQDQAKAVNDIFNSVKKNIADLRENTMIDLATEYLGDTAANGQSIANIVKMAEVDSSWCDYLYSVGRQSNPLLAAMGTVIRDAQLERNKKMMAISLRIRRATRRLYDSGIKNTEFMYDDNGYIVSDIDWDAYNTARKDHRNYLKYQQHLTGLDLEQEMEIWERQNTEDRIVDTTTGRTERVPSSSYRKAFNLQGEQLVYYNTMMGIKGELGSLLPQYAQKHYLPPQKRRSFLDAVAASKGSPKLIAKAILNKLRDMITIREDDMLDSRNGIVSGDEYGIRNGALDNTPYRDIPIFFVNKLRDDKFKVFGREITVRGEDELLKDFSGALQALAGVAINYECMSQVKDTVEFMGDFITDKKPAAIENGKPVGEIIEAKGIRLFKNLIGYGNATHTTNLINGFIDKHIYGVRHKNPTKWTKLAQSLLTYTSVRSLAVNVKGAIANYLVGEMQMLIEAGSGEFYNIKDYAWANMMVFGDNTLKTPGRIMDYMSNNVNSLPVLLAQKFDPRNDIFGEAMQERYFPNGARKMLNDNWTFIGYGMGEHMIHFVTMYAILHNTKVQIDGNDATLYDAFYVDNKSEGNSELMIKQNVKYKDEEGNWVDIDEAYLERIRDKIRFCNQNTHGSMNDEDKGLIHQNMMGRFVMNLRQWMVEHYSRRYRKMHWDASLRQYREGYYNTAFKEVPKLAVSWARAIFNFESEYATRWSELNDMQRANCKRALSELIVLASLLTLGFALGEPDEHKKDFWRRMWIYQTKRAIMETRASVPWGIPQEMTKMINSPIAATNTVNALLYPFMGISHVNETIESGRYKGWNKYGRNMLKYWVPFYNQIDQLMTMDTDDAQFGVFEYSIR